MLSPQSIISTLVEARRELNDWVYEQTNGIVQAGPFKGMQIYPDRIWGASNIAAELLGFHEEELHEVIEAQIERLGKLDNPVVVNVGCAEGYYATGFGYRLPKASVYAFDIDDRAVYVTTRNGENNRVTFTHDTLDAAFEKPDLVFMDCEGAERGYLDPEISPGLLRAVIVAEMHPSTSDTEPLHETMYRRFGRTHACRVIGEGGRNPNKSPLLWRKSSLERWLAVCEDRPCLMCWLVMEPKSDA
jgi:hypothetical protein